MSYEGTDHALCANGHLASFDALDSTDPYRHKTCFCGEAYMWVFMQDQTNGMDSENPYTLSPEVEVIEPFREETCNLGHTHVVSQARYKPVDNGTWRRIRR